MTELVIEHQNGKEYLSDKTLVVAIDDTGHEEFKDPNYQVFGIGGCAFMARDYQRLIKEPWEFMCRNFFPELQRPLHAAELRGISDEQIDALNYFFTNYGFFRIASTASIKSIKDVDNDFIEIIGSTLLQRICDIAKWTDFERVYIIFENSDRIEMKVLRSLSNKKIKRGLQNIDIDLGLMPKAACNPALEIADLIIHTAGTQVRSRISGNKQFKKDFENIFRNVDERLVSFMEITKVNEAKNA